MKILTFGDRLTCEWPILPYSMMKLNLRNFGCTGDEVRYNLASITPRDIEWGSTSLFLSENSCREATPEFYNFSIKQSIECGVREKQSEMLDMMLRVYSVDRQCNRVLQRVEQFQELLENLYWRIMCEM